MRLKRTACCGTLTKEQETSRVILSGWVQKRRDLGGLIFVDLRDGSGLVQVVFSPEILKETFNLAEKLRQEYVISVEGTVQLRPSEAVNPNLPTGAVEVEVCDFEVLNPSKPLPFPIEDDIDIREELRLRYRYLDLRRRGMREVIKIRHRTAQGIRSFLDKEGFMEVETPLMTRSTPEGARDYLIPSRLHRGHFFALPQSPQLFKQLLMISGLEKYYQLARCFRDEDLRADRQPEFTQLDIEMSFVDEDDVFRLVETMMTYLFESLNLPVPQSFPRISHAQAMERYGTDKPDIRLAMEIHDLGHVFRETEFKVFQTILEEGGVIKGICLKGGSSLSRKDIKELEEKAKSYGAKGLVWIALKDDAFQSPIKKFLSDKEGRELIEVFGANQGDLLLLVGGEKAMALETLGQLRLHVGKTLDLFAKGFHFLWVTHFPLLEYSEEEGRYVSEHHPFTMPLLEDMDLLDTKPSEVRARAYDLVLNGVELGGGSIRIHDRVLQEKMFGVLDLQPEEIQEKFGFLLEAFQYGAPPHGGIAFGFDRLVMLLAGEDSIRNIIPFPKTLRGTCPLTDAPREVYSEQLDELYLQLKDE